MVKVGIALGGGGARGFAHLGILKAIQELEVPIHCVAGTSIGAVVGGAYAAGILDKAIGWAERSNWKKLPGLFLEPRLSRKALIRGDRIESLFRAMMPVSDFSELSIPFAAVATDLMTGEEVVMSRGDVNTAIRASMSIPGVLSPVERNGCILVDGGMVDPVPVSVCRRLGAEKVIAVDLNCVGIDERVKSYDDLNLLSVIDETFRVVMNVAQNRSYPCDRAELLLTPSIRDVKLLDFHKAGPLVSIGYDYAMQQWDILHGFADAPYVRWL